MGGGKSSRQYRLARQAEMSRRFPDQVVCPHCGLTVAGKASTGETRGHGRQAVEAGRYTASCASNTKEAQEFEARAHQLASADRRAEFWRSRDPDPTVNAYGTPQGKR